MSCDSTHLQRHIMPLGVIFLNCCVTDLRNKQVINQRDGNILGPVSDIEVDTCSGKVVAIIVFGRPKCMGLFGRCDDIRICWEDIKVIGEDSVLVCYNQQACCAPPRKGGRFCDIFNSF